MVLAAIDPDGEASRALRAGGLRVTMPRLAMLTWLDGHPHATVDAIAAGVRERFGPVSTQAVYDMLAAGAASGLLRRIEPAGHPARFERRTGDHHHHLVCRRCGRTEDADRAIGAQPCLTAPEDLGLTVNEAEVMFWGVCPACKAAESSTDGVQHDEEV